ncbi:MAG: hypothetical protein ABI042_05295 [Verrucomicrobiota bacterium]
MTFFGLILLCLFSLNLRADNTLAAGSPVSASMREQALAGLREVLTNETSWPRIHAAEALLELDYPQGILKVMEEDLRKRGAEPQYRVVLWRVMARQSRGHLERTKWLGEIRKVFLDKNAPDRLHAVEALAKLGYNPQGTERTEFVNVSRSGHTSFALHAQWVLANSGEQKDEAALALYLKDPDESLRGLSGYAFRFLPKVHQESVDLLVEAAGKEPHESTARVNLIFAALVHGGADRQPAFLKDIRSYAVKGTAEEKYDAFTALARYGSASDLPLLEDQLKPAGGTSEKYEASADLRVAASSAILHQSRRVTHRLNAVDWGVIAVYLLVMLGIGYYYSLRTKNSDDYLLGGRSMRPMAVGLSLFATLLSTISYLAYPGEMIEYGPMMLAGYAATPLVYFVAGWFLIPHIMKLKVTSAYEIIEIKLGVGARLLAASLFLSMRLIWMAMIIYTTTVTVLIPLMGLDPKYSMAIAAVLGIITLVYTSMGGLRAVVVTDVVQTFILFAGAILSVILITVALGGVGKWFQTSWDPGWAAPHFWFDSTSRITFASAMMGGFLWWICTTGSDQMAIQRYLSTRDVKSARRVLAVSLVTDLIVTIFLCILGFALLSYFRAKPHLLPPGQTLATSADQLFPRYIAVGLPLGISGLVVAGLLAAGMSSLSSGINSSTTVLKVDFFDRFGRRPASGADNVRWDKIISVVIGILVVLISAVVYRVPGNLTESVNKLSGLSVGPLFLIFFMAMFVPWATSFGTVVGTIAAIAVAVGMGFFGLFGLSFVWIMPCVLGIGVIVASTVSLLPIGRRPLSIPTIIDEETSPLDGTKL